MGRATGTVGINYELRITNCGRATRDDWMSAGPGRRDCCVESVFREATAGARTDTDEYGPARTNT